MAVLLGSETRLFTLQTIRLSRPLNPGSWRICSRNMQISFVPLARRPAMAQIRSRCHLKIVASETTRAIRVEVESRAVKRDGRGPIVESTVYC